MAKPNRQARAASAGSTGHSAARYLEAAALLLLLAVLAFRPLLSEVYEYVPLQPWLAALAPAGPGPATTILIGAAIQLAVLCWLLSRLVDGRLAYRFTGLEIGWLICALAAVVSCGAAGNKRVAITAATDLLLQIAAAMLLVQLLTPRARLRLVALVIVTGAAVFALKCMTQWAYEFDETRQFYQQHATYGGADALDNEPGHRELFESRLQAGEATGYFFHSNVAGEYLILVAFAALGLSLARLGPAQTIGGRAAAAMLLAMPILCCVALWLTRSRAAMLAGLLGLVVLLGVAGLRWRRNAHRLRAAIAGAMLTLGGLAIGATLLTAWLGWPSAVADNNRRFLQQLAGSMTFRLQYWRGACAMIADHGLTGVGPGNFGRRYLQYKPPSAPEEVQNPHNLVFQMLAEWGWLGGVGLAVLFAGAAWKWLRAPPRSRDRSGGDGPIARDRETLVWLVAVGLLLMLGRVLLHRHQSVGFVFFEAVLPAIIWLVVTLLLCLALEFAEAPDRADHQPLWRPAVAVGLAAFVLANMVGFSFFTSGAGQTFWALLAVGLAVPAPRREPASPSSRRRCALAMAVFCVVAACYWVGLAYRPLRTAALIDAGRTAPRPTRQLTLYRIAVAADALDPSPPVLLVDWLFRQPRPMASPTETIGEAIRMLHEAIRRDPYQAVLYRRLAHAYELAYRIEPSQTDDLRAACGWMKRAVELYPTSAHGRVLYGRLLAQAARALREPDLFTQAIQQLRLALELNEQFPPQEVRRFRPDFCRQIEDSIRMLQQERSELIR
ncbi:MAG TPA: O-antigen ligase family protein [Phycisphaerae bacterium]|nr:O-antigen ligase family protein [Phycisphaerae bacterium]